MECKKMYFLLIVTIFSPLTFATWKMNRISDIPQDDGNLRTCKEWIGFYGIHDGNYFNHIKAIQNRNYDLDKELSRFFVGYAYKINLTKNSRYGNFDPRISPTNFCIGIDSEGDLKYHKFEALKNIKETCPDFIYFYGYSPNDVLHNQHISKSIKPEYQPYESIWSSMYQSYLKVLRIGGTSKPLLPQAFCDNLGKYESAWKMPFVTVEDIPITHCEDIIKLFDYSDNAQINYLKASTIYNPEFDKILPKVVLEYIKDLLSTNEYQAKNVEQFCIFFENTRLVLGTSYS